MTYAAQPSSPQSVRLEIEADDQAHARPPKFCPVHPGQAMIRVVDNITNCPHCN